MSITVHLWMIAVAATVAIAVSAVLWPVSKGGGDYNFAPAFDAALHFGLGVVAMLVVWLAYFAWVYFGGSP